MGGWLHGESPFEAHLSLKPSPSQPEER
jgi:hypothetical protein